MTTNHRQIDDENQAIPNVNGDDLNVAGTSSPTASLTSGTTSPMAIVDQSLANQKPNPYLTVESYFNFATGISATKINHGEACILISYDRLRSTTNFLDKARRVTLAAILTNYVTLEPYTGSFIDIPEISDRCTEGKVYSARLKIDKKVKVKDLLEKFPCRLRFNKDCVRTCHSSVFKNTNISPTSIQPMCEIMQFNCRFHCPALASQQ